MHIAAITSTQPQHAYLNRFPVYDDEGEVSFIETANGPVVSEKSAPAARSAHAMDRLYLTPEQLILVQGRRLI